MHTWTIYEFNSLKTELVRIGDGFISRCSAEAWLSKRGYAMGRIDISNSFVITSLHKNEAIKQYINYNKD